MLLRQFFMGHDKLRIIVPLVDTIINMMDKCAAQKAQNLNIISMQSVALEI